MFIRTLALSLIFSSATYAAAPEQILVPSDFRATYTAVDVRQVGDRQVEIITRREGTSGISFAKRLVDCQTMRFKYLASDGETLEALNRATPDPKMSPLFPGSISDAVSQYACRRVGL